MFIVNNSLRVRKQHCSYVIIGGANWIKAACFNKLWTAKETEIQEKTAQKCI